MGGDESTFSTEAVLGAPLILEDDGDEKVVSMRDKQGRKVELKRFSPI